MSTKAKPIPQGFHSVTPYLTARNAAQAIEFYKRAFGAEERYRLPLPDGRVGHCELSIGDSTVMVSDEFPEHDNYSPEKFSGSPVGIALYVENVDEVFQRAVKSGATVKDEVQDKFWGDRAGSVTDPFGHKWTILTHKEDVPPNQMKERMAKLFAHAEPKHAHAGA